MLVGTRALMAARGLALNGLEVEMARLESQAKTAMLACHASQRDWLLKHHGMDQYLEALKAWGTKRGQSCGVAFAEGYRQHLGHSYPQDNLLGQLLGTVGG